jgi:hypothetical protein
MTDETLPLPDLAAVLGVKADDFTYLRPTRVDILPGSFGTEPMQGMAGLRIEHQTRRGLVVGFAIMAGRNEHAGRQLEQMNRGEYLALQLVPKLTVNEDRYRLMVAMVSPLP